MTQSVNSDAVISVKNVSFDYGSRTALNNLSLTIREGSYTALVGTNGSGKSTLCRLICGLLEQQEGSIQTAPGHRLGLVFQSPKDQIVSSKVYRDTAFGPQNLKLSADEVEMRTIECLSVTELLDKAEASSNSLSLGQTQKLALAGMLAVVPDILILDEAVAMLDEQSRQSIYDFLDNWHLKGNTIIHITHDIEAVGRAHNVIGLEKGQLFYEGTAKDFLNNQIFVRRLAGEPLVKKDRRSGVQNHEGQRCTLSFKDVCFSYTEEKAQQEQPFIQHVSFDLYSGTLTALTGASGAGKSTLLELGAGLLKPLSGTVCCGEYPALAQQNCSAALFEAFAADDVAFGPKNDGVKGRALLDIVRTSMDKAGLAFEEYGERQTVQLSGGEQRRLAIAGILAMNRNIILFDEPTAGLDGDSRGKVMEMMRLLADEGKTVLFTTHHRDEADFADREIKLDNGCLVPDKTESKNPIENLLPQLTVYKAAGMLTGLKKASENLSGSGWKTKCRLEKLPAPLRIILFLLFFTLALVFRTIIPCSVMVGVAVIYCLFANFRIGRIIKSILRILPFLCFFAVFQIMFRPALPDEVCYTTWRFFTISPSKLWFCLNSILRTYAALLCVSAFFVSTPEYDLIDGLKKIIPSRNFILIVEIIFRFIPLLVDEAEVIIKTQIIRGGLGKVKGKLARIKAVVPLIVPLIIRTVKRSEILADAIVMRCFDEK